MKMSCWKCLLVALTLWAILLAQPVKLSFAEKPAARVPPEQAWKLGWPAIHGPYGNFVAPQTGLELVEDLSQAKVLWESEENDFGQAKHTTGAFKGRGKVAAVLGPTAEKYPGGWAAPIIAEGKLFATSFRPAGKLYDVKTLFDDTERAYLEAKDLLIALDAKTGKTLWKAAEPGGFVWGVGKRQGFQVAPAYYDGVVFSMGTTGRIFAFSAADGTKLWSTEPEPRMIEQRDKYLANPHVLQASARYGWQQSLTVAGGTLIVPRGSWLLGLDLKTGAQRWELSEVVSAWATPSLWESEGKQFLLTATVAQPGEAKLHLIDPQAGKIAWAVDGLHATHFSLSPSKTHVLVNVGSSIKSEGNASAPKDDEGNAYYGLPGAYRITPEKAERAWVFPDKPGYVHLTWFDSAAKRRILIRDGLVYYASDGPNKETDRRFIVARESTGEILVDAPRENDSWFQLINNRLLHAIDSSHGKRARFNFYAADPQHFRKLAGPWSPEQPLTTAYTVFMEPPIIDGKTFLRTERGTVVCYDLTKD